MAQQRLRRHHDQRFALHAHRLTAQHVEDLSRRSRHTNFHIVFGTGLHEAFQTGRGVLRPLAFVTVRQQHDQTGSTTPLGFTGSNELVDNDLGAVGEIAELTFPDHQFVRVGRRVTIIESQHSLFRQHRIKALEAGLLFLQILQRMIGAGIPAGTVLVVEGGMAVEESAATDVLAGNTHAITGHQHRGVGQVFSHTPVNRQIALAHGGTILDNLLDPGMQGEAFGNRRQSLRQTLQLGHRHGGVAGFDITLGQERGPVDRHRMLVAREHRVVQQLALVEVGAIFGDHLIGTLGSQDALGDQLVAVEFARPRMLVDDLVHQGLRHHRLVLLVVSKLAITDDVDHHVLVEGLAIFDGQLGNQRHGFRIVTIDVEDRCIDHLEDVGAVMTGAIVSRVGCREAHLVVDHDVQRTPHTVTARLREVEHFLVDTLASHRRIAVNEDGHHLLLAAFTAPYLAGIDRTFNHRVHDFQV